MSNSSPSCRRSDRDRWPHLDGSPQRKEKTFEALLRRLEMQAAVGPCSGLRGHPLDRSELARAAWTSRLADLPVLLVIKFRPEFHPPWTGPAQVYRAQPQPSADAAALVPTGSPLPEDMSGP